MDKTEETIDLTRKSRPETQQDPLPLRLLLPSAAARHNQLAGTMVINGYYQAHLYCLAFPYEVPIGWLQRLFRWSGPCWHSLHLVPLDRLTTMKKLARQQVNAGSTLENARRKNYLLDPEEAVVFQDAEELRHSLVRGEQKMYQLSWYVAVQGETEEEVKSSLRDVEAELGSAGIISRRAIWQAPEAWLSVLPLGLDLLQYQHTFTSEALAAINPLHVPVGTGYTGVVLGIEAKTGKLVAIDTFALTNANITIMAMSGAGKTYLTKTLITREHFWYGNDLIVIDPEDEYGTLISELGGELVRLDLQQGAGINPLELWGDSEGNGLAEKIEWLLGLFSLMLGELGPVQRGLLEQALIRAYQARSTMPLNRGAAIGQEEIVIVGKKRRQPLLTDVYQQLAEMEDPEARILCQGLYRWVYGAVNLFNCHTDLNLKNPLVCFVLKGLDQEEVKAVAAYVIAGYCWGKMKRQRDQRKIRLVLDEAHLLLKYRDTASIMARFARQCRKYNAGLLTISQNVDEFLLSEEGRAVALNSAVQILLRQHEAALDQVSQQFCLTDFEREFIQQAGRGEALVRVAMTDGMQKYGINVVASEYEHEIYCSR
ncbi:AAA-like domain-containing protein [Carboxydocella sporoproducens DSM 16521]|uniref:AAA-like domain-containing protein n=3 Tax=Clostridiales Family XVI. Incertae Sedis TaxID=543347 RepID=A0A1T4M234_9FIRM|nr:protein of unknown function DUF87 [Carboxydocella thermautotrophica]AVX31502.1 protein of unknown function DUF87 [Carboxydocella thermautotrophica]SJZ61002.1 AAA-like domain-containing protein [Carboxydocella sporoproducens DSM 16521]